MNQTDDKHGETIARELLTYANCDGAGMGVSVPRVLLERAAAAISGPSATAPISDAALDAIISHFEGPAWRKVYSREWEQATRNDLRAAIKAALDAESAVTLLTDTKHFGVSDYPVAKQIDDAIDARIATILDEAQTRKEIREMLRLGGTTDGGTNG